MVVIHPIESHIDTVARDLFEARGARRYQVEPPLEGWFDGADVSLSSVSPTGVRVEHTGYFKIGKQARMVIKAAAGGRMFAFEGRVIWNRILTPATESESIRYSSGLRAIDGHEILVRCIRDLEGLNRLRDSPGSILQKATRNTAGSSQLITLGESVPAEQINLVRNARGELSSKASSSPPPSTEIEAAAIADHLDNGLPIEVIRWVLDHEHELE